MNKTLEMISEKDALIKILTVDEISKKLRHDNTNFKNDLSVNWRIFISGYQKEDVMPPKIRLKQYETLTSSNAHASHRWVMNLPLRGNVPFTPLRIIPRRSYFFRKWHLSHMLTQMTGLMAVKITSSHSIGSVSRKLEPYSLYQLPHRRGSSGSRPTSSSITPC